MNEKISTLEFYIFNRELFDNTLPDCLYRNFSNINSSNVSNPNFCQKVQVVELIFRYRNFIISVSEKVLTGQHFQLVFPNNHKALLVQLFGFYY